MSSYVPKVIAEIAEIGRLSAGKALSYWAVLVVASWLVSAVFLAVVFLFFPISRIVTPDFFRLCEGGRCFGPSRGSEVCPQDTPELRSSVGIAEGRPADAKVYWAVCVSKGIAQLVIELPSRAEPGASASSGPDLGTTGPAEPGKIAFVFVSVPEAGGGLTVIPVSVLDGRTVEASDAEWQLIRIGRRNGFHPSSPAFSSPFPVEFLEVAVKDRLRQARGSESIDNDVVESALATLRDGVGRMDLKGRTKGIGAYYVRRSLSGAIQTSTFILFFSFVCIALCRFRVNVSEMSQEFTEGKKIDFSETKKKRQELLQDFAKHSTDKDMDSLEPGDTSNVLGNLSAVAVRWSREAQPSQIPSLVTLEQDGIARMWNMEYQPLRYILWAIPTVGFVGTVVGVGQAMMATSTLASPDKEVKMIGRGEVSSGIGVAFDTTLVALLLAIVANFLFYDLVAREHAGLQRLRDLVVRLVSGSMKSKDE